MKTIEQVQAFISKLKKLSNQDMQKALKIEIHHIIGARAAMNTVLDFINSHTFGFDNLIDGENNENN